MQDNHAEIQADEPQGEVSATRRFHLLCLYAVLGAFAFAFSPVWLGPILNQLYQLKELLAWELALSPVTSWVCFLSSSVLVSYLLSLVLLLDYHNLLEHKPVKHAALLGMLALASVLYVSLYLAVPQLPLAWWVDRLVQGLHANTPVWLAQAVVWGLQSVAYFAAFYLGSVVTLLLLVTTCAAPKQAEL